MPDQSHQQDQQSPPGGVASHGPGQITPKDQAVIHDAARRLRKELTDDAGFPDHVVGDRYSD